MIFVHPPLVQPRSGIFRLTMKLLGLQIKLRLLKWVTWFQKKSQRDYSQ